MNKTNLSVSALVTHFRTIKYIALLTIVAGYTPFSAQNSKEITMNGKTYRDLNGNGKLDIWENTGLSTDQRIDAIVNDMTNEEKASFLIGIGMPEIDAFMGTVGDVKKGKVQGAAGGTYPLERFGIPSVIVADGPAGLRINPKRENDNKTYYATAFPVGTSLASSWNENLITEVGKAMGNEVKEYGVDVLLAPALNIQRNPLNGRNFEYYSEDPLVSGKIAAAYVKGIQSNGVGTSIKHYVANNQETNRADINEHISERALREIYLKGFEIAVKEADPWTVMSSYNKVNGVYTSASKDLLTTILRNEWGYKGMVMTDWFGGYGQGIEAIIKGNSDEVNQMIAGNDLLMPGLSKQKTVLLEALNSGKLPKEIADRNIKKILQLVFRSPVFADYKYTNQPNLDQHGKIARNAATEGMVLLENRNNTLPFSDFSKSIALFGTTSYQWITGGTGSGSVNNKHTISLLEGLNNAGYKLDKGLVAQYQPFTDNAYAKEMERRKEKGILAIPQRLPEMSISDAELLKIAEKNDIALITIGRNSGESGDRDVTDFNLAADEIEMIEKVSKAFHNKGKKVAVILNIGGVIETASWKDKVDAVLLAWQPGQEGGNSVADVLSGKVNPSGKLAQTFPIKYADVPFGNEFPGTPKDNPKEITYKEGVYVGYRYYDTFKVQPSYEFGYGKSYTTFSYSVIEANQKVFDSAIKVYATVTNTGKISGKEIVQLYVSAPSKTIDKPVQELKAFAKTKELKPGESQTLTFTLRPEDLASYVTARAAWVAEAGNYEVRIGSSSRNVLGTIEFNVPKELIVKKVENLFKPDQKFEDLKP